MVKITLTHDGETFANEGDLVLAFVCKRHSDSEGILVDTHLSGSGNDLNILTGVATALGALIHRLIDRQTRRTLAYVMMLQALSDGFDRQGSEIAEKDGKEARDGDPCDAAGEPEEEADGV